MSRAFYTRLSAALDRRDISFAVRREIMNAVFAPTSELRETLRVQSQFDGLLYEVGEVRRVLLSNRSKWVPVLVPLYNEYVDMLRQVHADVTAASALMLKDPNSPGSARAPATLAQITAISERKNKALPAHEQGPTRTGVWTSWVAPADKARLIEAFDTAYACMGRGRGNRFIPFSTQTNRANMKRGVARHRKFIDDMRRVTCNRPDGKGSTHYRALHLCALRMAELWLDNYEKDIRLKHRHPATDPVPVNWTHMLTSDMRQRVAAADANPTDYIDPTGLGSFLDEPEA